MWLGLKKGELDNVLFYFLKRTLSLMFWPFVFHPVPGSEIPEGE
jgi:hypothetical protein